MLPTFGDSGLVHLEETLMHLKRIQIHIFSLLLLSLSACSGGGDTPMPSPTALPAAPAEGLWIGSTNTNRTVTGIVLNDGVYWFLYSVVGNPTIIAGVVQGDSSSQNGTLTSSNAMDFSVERGIPPTLTASINGNYTVKQSLNGTVSYQNTQDTFTTTYDSDYELSPDINAVAGTYIGPVAVNETAEVTVFSTGLISGKSQTSPACTITGSFSPRTQGNVFDVIITFGGQSTCGNGSDTVRGVAFFDAGTLYSAALNADRTNGVVFIGTKKP